MKYEDLKKFIISTKASKSTIYRFYKKNEDLFLETKKPNGKRLFPTDHARYFDSEIMFDENKILRQENQSMRNLIDCLADKESLQHTFWQMDWSFFFTVAYKLERNKNSCFKQMHGLYDYLVVKYGTSTELRLFFKSEPFTNRKGYHNHFVIYIEDKKLHELIVGQTLNLNEVPKEQSNIQNGMDTKGSWFAVIKGNTVRIQFRNDDEDNSTTSFQLSELTGLTKDMKGEFTITREAGTMNFEGKFEGNKGMGTYTFTANKNFSAAMAQEGVAVANEGDLMAFFMVNVTTSYVKMLKKNGYNKIDKDQLIPLAALNANEEYIASIKQAGIPDFDLDDLIPFKSMGIDKAFIDEIRQAGYKNITADNIIALKSQGVDGKYISDFHNSTNGKEDDETGDNIIAFKSLHIDAAFVDSFKSLGYNDLSNDDLMAFKSLNITPNYISEFEKIGYKNIKPDDLLALKSLNVTPKYISDFEKAGFNTIKIDDLVALKSQNITPDLIREYKNLGFTDLNIDDVIGAKSMGVSPAFIKLMKGKGHNFETLEKYMELKAVVGTH